MYHFQSHVDSVIKFDPVSNAIVGKTDVGKSVLTRALFWVFYNRPVRIGHKGHPDEFTTWGQNHCFVSVLFTNGTEIIRGRNKNENYYILRKDDEVKEFRGFGFEVPKEILDAHGMYLISDDGSTLSLNISQQLDPLFMFEEGASKRAKVIGKLSGADRMDGAISIINSWDKGISNTKKDNVAKITELNAKLESYAFLDDLEASIQTLSDMVLSISTTEQIHAELTAELCLLTELNLKRQELVCLTAYAEDLITIDTLIVSLERLTKRHAELSLLVRWYYSLTSEKNTISNLIGKVATLNTLDTHIERITSLLTQSTSISIPYTQYMELERELKNTSVILSKENSINEIEKILLHLKVLITQYNSVLTSYTESTRLTLQIEQGKNFIGIKTAELSDVISKYESLLKEHNVCPVCKTPLSDETIEHIVHK